MFIKFHANFIFQALCIKNFVANFIEILLLTFLLCFSAYKVFENREKDKIDEVSVLKYTENQYA